MLTSEMLWLALALGGIVGAAIGSLLDDVANGMALGFVGGVGLAIMLDKPSSPDSA